MSDYSEDQVRKGIDDLLEKTGYLEVFSVISMLRSTHLSYLARIIGKSKSTILATLDKMRNRRIPLIEFDEPRTLGTRGVKKFYQLTDFGKNLEKHVNQIVDYESQERQDVNAPPNMSKMEFEKMVKQEAKRNIKNYGETLFTHILTLGSELNYYFQRAAAHQYVELGKRLLEGKQTKESRIPLSSNFSSLKQIRVTNFNQVMKLQRTVQNFLSEIEELQQEFGKQENTTAETDLTKTDEGQIIFVSLTPIIND